MSLIYQTTHEGAGAQYQRIIALLAIAKIHDLKFLHYMITIDHNYHNDPLWNEKWDNFFNIKSITNSITYEDIKDKGVISIHTMTHHHLRDILKSKALEHLYAITLPFQIVDTQPNLYYTSVQDDIRKAYFESNMNRPLNLFRNNRTNIAIHIRVINDCDDEYEKIHFENLEGRFEIKEHQYKCLISSLRHMYTDADIHIFSQQNLNKKYKAIMQLDDVYLHLDTDAMDTFHHMCSADVLVIAKSSFSYLAGIYNKNKVIYFPLQHPPLNAWESIYNYITKHDK